MNLRFRPIRPIQFRPRHWFVLVAAFLFTVIFLLGRERPTGILCIDNEIRTSNDDLELSYIEREQCYGYRFMETPSIGYHSFNSDNNGRLEVVVGKNHDSWLRGKIIILKSESVTYDSHAHFSNLRKVYKKMGSEFFSQELGLSGYLKTDSFSEVRMAHLFDIGEETGLPLYASCLFHSKSLDPNTTKCGVNFSLSPNISIHFSAYYQELINTPARAAEVKSFVSSLIYQHR